MFLETTIALLCRSRSFWKQHLRIDRVLDYTSNGAGAHGPHPVHPGGVHISGHRPRSDRCTRGKISSIHPACHIATEIVVFFWRHTLLFWRHTLPIPFKKVAVVYYTGRFNQGRLCTIPWEELKSFSFSYLNENVSFTYEKLSCLYTITLAEIIWDHEWNIYIYISITMKTHTSKTTETGNTFIWRQHCPKNRLPCKTSAKSGL